MVCLALIASAQFDTSVVLGTVRDASGNIVPGSTVKLLNIGTGIEATTITGETGDYQFLNVKIGNYKVIGGKGRILDRRVDNVNVTVNARQRVDIALAVGQVTEIVQVTAASARSNRTRAIEVWWSLRARRPTCL